MYLKDEKNTFRNLPDYNRKKYQNMTECQVSDNHIELIGHITFIAAY